MTRRLLPWVLAALVLGTIAEAQQVRAGLINLASMVTGTLPVGNGGTGATSLAGANIAVTTGKLSQFAATTSSELAGVLSDETGSGALAFATSPTFITPTLGSATATFLGIGIGTTPDIAGTLLHARSNSTTVADSTAIGPDAIISGGNARAVLLSTTYSTDVSNGFYLRQQTTGEGVIEVGNGTLATSNKGNQITLDPTQRFIQLYPGSSAGSMRLSAVNDPTNGTDINSLLIPFFSRIDATTHYANVNFQARPTDGTNEATSQYQQLWEMTWTDPSGFTQDLFGIWDSTANAYALSMVASLGRTVRIGYAVSGKDFTLQANGPINNADPTTRTASTPLFNGSQTWNSGGETFDGWLLDVTSTASAAASRLLNLKVGGSSVFSVSKAGAVTAASYTNNLSAFAATTSAQLRGVLSDELGTGAALFDGATPTGLVLTNATGLPISSGVSGLGTGVATFLATPSSANLASAVTDETGSGALVFATSPTLVTPALGVASATSLSVAGTITRTDGSVSGQVPKIYCAKIGSSDTITASVVSTTETAFATVCTIKANTITTNTVLKVTLVLEMTTSASPPTVKMRLRMGGLAGTIMVETNNITVASSSTAVTTAGAFVLQGTAAPGASVNVESAVQHGFMLANLTSQNVTAQPVALATNADKDMTFTVVYSANTAANSLTLRQLIVEQWN